MEKEGSKTVGLAGLKYKRQIIATFTAALDGQFLPIQLLYQGKTNHCHSKFSVPSEFDVFHTPTQTIGQMETHAFVSMSVS